MFRTKRKAYALKMKCLSALMMTAAAVFFIPAQAFARDRIHIVGSSTVYPFVTAVAEEFGRTTHSDAPIVEATGTGGGFKLFCNGTGDDTPDIANASRAIKDGEREMCAKNGVKDIIEIKIGFDGIVLANSKKSAHYNLTKEQVFLALAKQVPGKDGKLVDNPYMTWSDIDQALPAAKIEVYGPPTTSGTRDAFVELVMDGVCEGIEAFRAAWPDKEARKKSCQMLREDGRYIEAGENDNLIIQKLQSNPEALGIFGFSFLEQNMDTVQGSHIGGVQPMFETIADDSYSISRPLFIYVKSAHAVSIPGIREFVTEMVSDNAAGEEGYLAAKGLIPLPEEDLKTMQERAGNLPGPAKSN